MGKPSSALRRVISEIHVQMELMVSKLDHNYACLSCSTSMIRYVAVEQRTEGIRAREERVPENAESTASGAERDGNCRPRMLIRVCMGCREVENLRV